jgi:hypothetical protein
MVARLGGLGGEAWTNRIDCLAWECSHTSVSDSNEQLKAFLSPLAPASYREM